MKSRSAYVWAAAIAAVVATWSSYSVYGDVPTGNEAQARKYYRSLAKSIHYPSQGTIEQTTLADVATYLGYAGITGPDLQNISSPILMDPKRLLAPCTGACPETLEHQAVVVAALGSASIGSDDILATRFFAPKIMNINLTPDVRPIGWRKLVRIRARDGSQAKLNHIATGIILFNFFTNPGSQPFLSESVNTQVMLVTETDKAPLKNPPMDTLYWLDYDANSNGGRLAFALNAAFDANELPAGTGKRDYFVPSGCVACHGANDHRSMVNYLDTDHWFDRLENDFVDLKATNLPLLFDARTNNTSTSNYAQAFDVIRRFNGEADLEVQNAQPKHDETLASAKWLELHRSNVAHVGVLERSIGPVAWSGDDDRQTLEVLNQYCFRCHGTIKYSVFNKENVRNRHVDLVLRIDPNEKVGTRMPPDRPLPAEQRALLLRNLPRKK